MNIGELKKLLECYEDEVEVTIALPSGEHAVGRVYSGAPLPASGDEPTLMLEPLGVTPWAQAHGSKSFVVIWKRRH